MTEAESKDVAVAHIRCGTDIQQGLQVAGIGGDFIEASDPVCCGPVPAGIDGVALDAMRAAYMADAWNGEEQAFRQRLDEQRAALSPANLLAYDRIVLWFEHDLYDQIILARLLSELGAQPGLRSKLWLLSIDRFEGLDRFIGLGQLSAPQLASLWGRETPVSVQMIREGSMVWQAFRAADPTALAGLPKLQTLPFAARALARHLLDFPWVKDGLSLTQRLSLIALSNQSSRGGPPATPATVFRELMSGLEPLPWLGDLMFFGILRGLATAPHPAIRGFAGPHDPITLSDIGRAVLTGSEDWIALNGIQEWRGGVHLTQPAGVQAANSTGLWRWDNDRHGLLVG